MDKFDGDTGKRLQLIAERDALPGRDANVEPRANHPVLGVSLLPPFPAEMERIIFGLGCFWGAERRFWQQGGVYTTAVGYGGGFTRNPSYQEVCSGATGHTEVVLVVFDPTLVCLDDLLKIFWESHDPTQGMRQGNDIGTQYRSCIYTVNADQQRKALSSKELYTGALNKGLPRGSINTDITTEIAPLDAFYYAEDYHQQYLAKNPNGYCGLRGTGVEYCK